MGKAWLREEVMKTLHRWDNIYWLFSDKGGWVGGWGRRGNM
jgi:hypothetical protein